MDPGVIAEGTAFFTVPGTVIEAVRDPDGDRHQGPGHVRGPVGHRHPKPVARQPSGPPAPATVPARTRDLVEALPDGRRPRAVRHPALRDTSGGRAAAAARHGPGQPVHHGRPPPPTGHAGSAGADPRCRPSSSTSIATPTSTSTSSDRAAAGYLLNGATTPRPCPDAVPWALRDRDAGRSVPPDRPDRGRRRRVDPDLRRSRAVVERATRAIMAAHPWRPWSMPRRRGPVGEDPAHRRLRHGRDVHHAVPREAPRAAGARRRAAEARGPRRMGRGIHQRPGRPRPARSRAWTPFVDMVMRNPTGGAERDRADPGHRSRATTRSTPSGSTCCSGRPRPRAS